MMKKPLRQGDVLLIPEGHPCFTAPSGDLKPVPQALPGRHVLAFGEATGHHHSVVATGTALLEAPTGTRYLDVQEGGQSLTHQEHSPIPLEPTRYQVVRQQEWTDENEPRAVQD